MDGMLGGPGFDFELDQVRIDIDIEIEQQIYAFYANYGITDVWDIGVIVPFIRMKATADATASIYDPTPGSPTPHSFGGSADPVHSSAGGKEFGIGDVLLRSKYNLIKEHDWMPATSIGGQVAFPSGDEDDLMGSGSMRFATMLIMEKKLDPFNIHINFGHDYVVEDHQLNSIRYVLGFDVPADETWTLAFDIIGRWEYDGDGIGDDQFDAAVGTKFALKEDLIISLNLIFPINRDDGLRATYTFIFGIEYTF